MLLSMIKHRLLSYLLSSQPCTDHRGYCFQVAILPETTMLSVCRLVMTSLVSQHQTTSLGGRLPAYDGRNTMYTAGELPFKTKEFEVTLSDNKIGGASGAR